VRVQDLLGVSERTLQTRANDVEVLGHLLVVDVVTLISNASVTVILYHCSTPIQALVWQPLTVSWLVISTFLSRGSTVA
jgi:hypothetical protein